MKWNQGWNMIRRIEINETFDRPPKTPGNSMRTFLGVPPFSRRTPLEKSKYLD